MPFSDTQSKALSAKLSAKYVKTREGAGRTLSYLEGWHIIAEANRIFGFDAWDRETVATRCVWEGVSKGLNACSYVAQVKVRVRAGETVIIREGSGSGHGTGPTPGEAHESAVKEAETDAMKRALATFGNSFGLALYDKQRHGVRRAGAKKGIHAGPQPVSWVVLSPTGAPISTHSDPVEYCSAVRRLLESLKAVDEAMAFWKRNQDTIAQLRQALPELKSEKGQNYGEILGALYTQRLEALQKQRLAENRQAKIGKVGVGIDKSRLPIGASRRLRDKEHLRYVATQPCLHCGRVPSQAHHLRFAQPRAMSRKVSDEWVVPLCAAHHRALHDVGNEARWWQERGIDPISEAERLWRHTNGVRPADTPREHPINRQAVQ